MIQLNKHFIQLLDLDLGENNLQIYKAFKNWIQYNRQDFKFHKQSILLFKLQQNTNDTENIKKQVVGYGKCKMSLYLKMLNFGDRRIQNLMMMKRII